MIMKEMKQMPYKIGEGAMERAKYRAKMAVREVAHPETTPSRKVRWQWASATAAVAVVIVVAVVWFAKPYEEPVVKPETPLAPMESLIAQMNNVSDDILNEFAVDAGYYLEEENQL
jgi:anti-sigma-K factor RskA